MNKVPTVLVKRDVEDYCEIHVSVRNGTYERRQGALEKILKRSISETNTWKKKYIISGVDYIDYREFYVEFYENCDTYNKSEVDFKQELLDIYHSEGIEREGVRLDVILIPTQIIKVDQSGAQTPISIFDKYAGGIYLEKCALSIPIISSSSLDELVYITNKMNDLVLRYRFPISEKRLVDDQIYILFSQDCDKKNVLFEKILNKLKEDQFDTGRFFGPVNFSPDIVKFRFSVGAAAE